MHSTSTLWRVSAVPPGLVPLRSIPCQMSQTAYRPPCREAAPAPTLPPRKPRFYEDSGGRGTEWAAFATRSSSSSSAVDTPPVASGVFSSKRCAPHAAAPVAAAHRLTLADMLNTALEEEDCSGSEQRWRHSALRKISPPPPPSLG